MSSDTKLDIVISRDEIEPEIRPLNGERGLGETATAVYKIIDGFHTQGDRSLSNSGTNAERRAMNDR